MRAGTAKVINFIRQRWAVGAVFLANFGASKAIAFFGPLLIAAVLPAELYGTIELAASVGLLTAMVLGFGLPGALPQLMLLRKPIEMLDVTALSAAVPAALMTMVALGLWLLGDAPVLAFLCLAAGPPMFQLAASSYCRVASRRNFATWADNFSLLLYTALGVVLWATGAPLTLTVLFWLTAAINGVLIVAAIAIATSNHVHDVRGRVLKAIWIGFPIMVAGTIGSWIASSGRVLTGVTLGVADVAIFGFCLRLAAIVLIPHYLLATGLFSRVYTLPARQADKLYSIYLAMMGIACVLLGALGAAALPLIPTNAIAPPRMEEARSLFPMIAAIAYYWVTTAALEMRINRVRRFRVYAAAGATVAVVAAAGFTLATAGFGFSLTGGVAVLAMQSALLVSAQIWILWRRGAKMPLTAVAIGGISSLLAAVAMLSNIIISVTS